MDSPIKLRNDFEFNGRESVDSGTGDLENDIVDEFDFIYVMENMYWNDLCKFGYVYGNDNNLINRLNDSSEKLPEKTKYKRIFKIRRN